MRQSDFENFRVSYLRYVIPEFNPGAEEEPPVALLVHFEVQGHPHYMDIAPRDGDNVLAYFVSYLLELGFL